MSPLEKLIMKKKEEGRTMDPMEQKAKLGNLMSLKDEMSGMMKGDLHPAKVEVAAGNPKDLKEGSDMAKSVIPGDSDEESEESPEHEAMESPEEEKAEGEDEHMGDEPSMGHEALSHEEIDQLQMLLEKLKNSKIA